MHDDWYEQGLPHVWLPYCQMQVAPPPLPVVRTHGCRIVLADGRELIDGIASWWSVCHGYNHPHILECVARQLETMPHVMFGGLVHEPALRLAGRLTALAPPGLTRVFFSDSGSVAVEVALKIALQYWRNVGKSGKDRFLCFTNGYHGDTFGAMAVSDPEKSMHKALRGALVPQRVVDIPGDEASLAELDAMLAQRFSRAGGDDHRALGARRGRHALPRRRDLAALHAPGEESTASCSSPMKSPPDSGARDRAFACEEAGISPDILCLGKALTGGTIGMGATLASEEIFASFLSDDWETALMHGPTFMANPLACAAANASLDLFEREPRAEQVQAIEAGLRSGLEPCRSLPHVVDVRVKGAIGVVQLEENVDVYSLRPRFVEQGVWVRPFKDIVYLMPPFVISGEELDMLTRAVCAVVADVR